MRIAFSRTEYQSSSFPSLSPMLTCYSGDALDRSAIKCGKRRSNCILLLTGTHLVHFKGFVVVCYVVDWWLGGRGTRTTEKSAGFSDEIAESSPLSGLGVGARMGGFTLLH